MRTLPWSSRIDHHALQLWIFQRPSCAARDTGQCIIRNNYGEPGSARQDLIQSRKQAPPARHYDASIVYVGGKLRLRRLKRTEHGVHYLTDEIR